MGNFEIKNRSLSSQGEYTDQENGLVVNVNFNENANEGTLQSINGNVQSSEDRAYVGNFNGRQENGKMVYTINAALTDMTKILAALTDIESQINTPAES